MFKSTISGKLYLHFISSIFIPSAFIPITNDKYYSELFINRNKRDIAKDDLSELFLSGRVHEFSSDQKSCFDLATSRIYDKNEYQNMNGYHSIINYIRDNALFSIATFEMDIKDFVSAAIAESMDFDCIRMVRDYKFNGKDFVEFDRWVHEDLKKII